MLVHMVFNAHLDPVWLWPWQASLDELLATCRSACDRLDKHKDVVFTRGEAWVYEQVEKLDPKLFRRIQKHVRNKQWEIVGGWWVQPDCNLPSGFAFEKQIALGKRYFKSRFGFFPRIAYNVDTFGHAATLPAYLRAAGQDRYVMMRPQEHELRLPARLFRWRGYEGGPEVLTFRIARAYCTGRISLDFVKAAMDGLPPGVEHTMCFVGLGDHGGGPTEKQIAWIRENQDALPGCKLVFSSPSRFFDAVAQQAGRVPLVTGELQHHAIGCYTMYRPVKAGVRRAEHLLKQAEVMQATKPRIEVQPKENIEKAWQYVCLHQFHDTLGGTCIPSAYPQVHAQLGFACAVADDVLQLGLRAKLKALPDDPLQRVVAFNASDAPYEGYAQFEPWLAGASWQPHWRLLDERNRAVPVQVLQREAVVAWPSPNLLFKLAVPPGGMRVLRIQRDGKGRPAPAGVRVDADRIASGAGAACASWQVEFPAEELAFAPRLELIEDPSDTWTHGQDRYMEGPAVGAEWNPPATLDRGPLMASLLQTGRIGESRLEAEWRVYADEPFVELRLRVHWLETRRLLKLTVPMPDGGERRTDGILGGQLARLNDGKERPLRDWTRVGLKGGKHFAVLAPDVFALDALPQRVRLTLLRGAPMAHHEPHLGIAPRMVVGDHGAHEFRFRFLAGKVETETLDRQALALQRPLLFADLTRGMPPREY
jgi:alpha-mannosidase